MSYEGCLAINGHDEPAKRELESTKALIRQPVRGFRTMAAERWPASPSKMARITLGLRSSAPPLRIERP